MTYEEAFDWIEDNIDIVDYDTYNDFLNAMDDDFNTSQALAILFSIESELNGKLAVGRQYNEIIDDLNDLKSLDINDIYNLEVVYKTGKSKNWWFR